jgi:hypothetical protein
MKENEITQLAFNVTKTLGKRFTPLQKNAVRNAVVRNLLKHFEGKRTIVWDVDDVLDSAASLRVTITPAQAEEILNSAVHEHDESVGLSWRSFDHYIDKYRK